VKKNPLDKILLDALKAQSTLSLSAYRGNSHRNKPIIEKLRFIEKILEKKLKNLSEAIKTPLSAPEDIKCRKLNG
jgi:hypothetical protein